MTRIVLIVAAIGLTVVTLPPLEVERLYSTGVYPAMQSAITAASNDVPFALFDALLVVAVAWLLWRLLDLREQERWIPAIAGLVVRVAGACALLYLVFLAAWGLNYRRVPLRNKLVFSPQGASAARARDLAQTAVERLNALHEEAHREGPTGGIDAALSAAFLDAQRMLGVRRPARVARPKRSLLDPYFHAAGVGGMTDPYFLETLMASDLLPFEEPFIVAHEWSHLAGFADESEASFVGWLACVHGPPRVEYSGWLFLYGETAGGLDRDVRTEVAARLDEGPREDLQAIAERVRRQTRPLVSMAGWRVYDRYLKANQVAAGNASYAQVVQLVLGTRFSAQWRPEIRPLP